MIVHVEIFSYSSLQRKYTIPIYSFFLKITWTLLLFVAWQSCHVNTLLILEGIMNFCALEDELYPLFCV